MFSIDFLKCNIIISIIIFAICLLTYVFKKYLSAKFNYILGLVLLISLFIPFIPLPQINFNFMFNCLELKEELTESYDFNSIDTSTNYSQLFTDNQESISKENWALLNNALLLLWILGMICASVKMLYVNYRIYQLRKYSIPNNNIQVKEVLDSCLKEMNIKREIPIRITSGLDTPGISGFFKPCILFPKYSIKAIPLKNLRFIILHELQHYRHKDILINYMVCVILIIYWFNPFVRRAMRFMRQMQEVFCDVSVLDRIDSSAYYDYGNALIDFAELISKQNFSPIYNISGSYEQMKLRIFTISHYKKASLFNKLKDILILILIAIVIFFSLYVYLFFSSSNSAALNNINYTTLDLSSYFPNNDGCFVLYNSQYNSYSIYNTDNCLARVSPDSTYKLYSALAGLENSVITPDDTLQFWSGKQYNNTYWNSNQTLESAMRNSVNWYFNNLDEKVGYQKLQDFFEYISYGNKDLSGGMSTYWRESSLLISPLEQVQLLTNLWNNKWDFDGQNIQSVKESICISKSQAATLYGKTGTGYVDEKYINGWFIGVVESNNNTFVFATNIKGNDNCDGQTAANITLNILSHLGIYLNE